MPVLPPVSDESDPVLKEVFKTAREVNGSVSNLYRQLANSPHVLRSWTQFAWNLRFASTITGPLQELVILNVAKLAGSEYEWAQHVPIAERMGLTAEQVASIRTDSPGPFSDIQRAVLAATSAVVMGHQLPDDLTQVLLAAIGSQGIVELVVTATFYVMVARTIDALNVEVDA